MTTEYVCLKAVYSVAIIFFYCCSVSVAYGQMGSGSDNLVDCSGIVQPATAGAASVELSGGTGAAYHAEVDSSGYFRFTGIAQGEYRGRILSQYGSTLDLVYVSAYRGMPMVILRLPEKQREAPGAGTISMALLQHKVPAKARKELDSAMRAVKKNDTSGAIDHLRKAVELDPQFMEAHNSLGMRYVQSNQPDLALDEFQKALAMDPHNAVVQANIAAALIGLNKGVDAEKAARRSVQLNGASARAHFLLGLALLQQGKYTPELEKQMIQASAELPGAHLMLGKAYIELHEYDKAAVELKSYLTSGRQEERAEVTGWLKRFDDFRSTAQR